MKEQNRCKECGRFLGENHKCFITDVNIVDESGSILGSARGRGFSIAVRRKALKDAGLYKTRSNLIVDSVNIVVSRY